MIRLLFLPFVFALALEMQGQNSIGLRLGVLLNKIHDCYGEDKDYRNQPAAMGGYGFFAWRINPDWYLQTELGYSQRNTRAADSGVSHYYSSEYRLKQIEMTVLGKFPLDFVSHRLLLMFGATSGYAISGRQYITGGSVGPTSIDEYRDVDFENFALKRFQIGPVMGLEFALPLFETGEVLIDGRYAYYPENDLHDCEHPNETRFSFSLGYRWNLGERKMDE